MSQAKLDQVTKGASAPHAERPIPTRPRSQRSSTTESTDPADPLSILPSSPPQIYQNLLILEAGFRSRYLELRARRRQHTFFLLLLTAWTAFFFYALFMRPREDGKGLGGSVYWVVEMAQKLALMGGLVTALLAWGTGQWERGIRWPRRWVPVTNRGLRTINLKLIIVKGPWYKEMISALAFLVSFSPIFPSGEASWHWVEHVADSTSVRAKRSSLRSRDGSEEVTMIQEDLSPGGDYVKLLLLPKPFSPDFRENWELYRTEYWEKENPRREELLRRVIEREKETAKKSNGAWWRTWLSWDRPGSSSGKETEQGHMNHHHHGTHSNVTSHGHRLERGNRTRSNESLRSDSPSRTSSRSSTPTVEWEERDHNRDPIGSEKGSLRGKTRRKESNRA